MFAFNQLKQSFCDAHTQFVLFDRHTLHFLPRDAFPLFLSMPYSFPQKLEQSLHRNNSKSTRQIRNHSVTAEYSWHTGDLCANKLAKAKKKKKKKSKAGVDLKRPPSPSYTGTCDVRPLWWEDTSLKRTPSAVPFWFSCLYQNIPVITDHLQCRDTFFYPEGVLSSRVPLYHL